MKEGNNMKFNETRIMSILNKYAALITFSIFAFTCAAVDIEMPLPPGTARSLRDVGRDTMIVTNIYAMYQPQAYDMYVVETEDDDNVGVFIATPGCMNYFSKPTAAELVAADLDYIELKALSNARTFDLFIGKEYEPLIYWKNTNMPITVKSEGLSINGKTNYVTTITNLPAIIHSTQFPGNAIRMTLEYVDYSESEPQIEKVVGIADNTVTNKCEFKVVGKNFDDVDRMLIAYVTNSVKCTSAEVEFTKNADFSEITAVQFPELPKTATKVKVALMRNISYRKFFSSEITLRAD